MLILINQYAGMALYNQAWMNNLEVTHTQKIFLLLQDPGIHCSIMRKIFPVKIFYVCQEAEVTLGIYK